MTKLKLLSIAVVGLLVLNVCIVGFLMLRRPPNPQEGRMPPGEAGPKQRIIEMLHFNKAQADQYAKLIDQHKTAISQLNESIRATKNSLYRSLVDKNITLKDSLVNKLGMLQVEIENTHYDHFIAIKKLCQPDQLGYFKNLTGELAGFFGTEGAGPRPGRR